MTIILFGLLLVPPSPPSWEKTQEKRRAKGRTPDHAAVGGQKLPSRRGARENEETVETIWKPVWKPQLFLRKPWKPYFTLIKLILFNFDKENVRFPQFPTTVYGFHNGFHWFPPVSEFPSGLAKKPSARRLSYGSATLTPTQNITNPTSKRHQSTPTEIELVHELRTS